MTFNSAQELINSFGLNGNQNYYDVVALRDRKVGFSVKRKYPVDINYKPTRLSSGEPNDVAVFWITYLHPSEARRVVDPNRVPIALRVASFNLYVAEHWDYDFEDPESPTRESVEANKASIKPLELDENEEYFFDHSRNIIINAQGKTVTGVEILDKLFQQHCDTAHRWKGLKIRSKISAHGFAYNGTSWLIDFIKEIVLKDVFGRTIEEDDAGSLFTKGYPIASLKKLSTDSLEIFGYKAPRGIIVLYAGLIVLTWYFKGKAGSYLETIADKELLFLTHSIFSIWFLDFVGPLLMLGFLNLCVYLRKKMLRMRVEL